MASRVSVYIAALTTNKESTNIENLRQIFSNPIFNVQARYIPPPASLPPSKTMSSEDQLQAFRFIEILKIGLEESPDDYMIFIWENSVSVVNSDIMASIVEHAIIDNSIINPQDPAGKWELLYLTRWLDRCDEHSFRNNEELDIPGGATLQIVESLNTLGFQCYLITPYGRLVLLGLAPMLNGQLFTPIIYPVDRQINLATQRVGIRRWVTTPNVVEFDIEFDTTMSGYQSNVIKMCECSPARDTTEQPINFAPLLFGLLIIAAILLIAWAMVKIGPCDKNFRRERGSDAIRRRKT